ncbi:MAG: hypothetical protein R2854_17405 [Caldilineaceae bacterium]
MTRAWRPQADYVGGGDGAQVSYWQRIYGRKLYDTEQLQVADIILAELEKIYPGIGGDVKVTDVATPLSYERYTGNWLPAPPAVGC